MTVLFQQVDRRTRLGALILDVLLTEEVSFESQVTNYPVEDGTEISDHITQGTKRIRISGMVATADASGGWGFLTQLGAGADFRANNPQEAKLVDVIEALERMHASRQVITVSTGQMVYENMAFANLSAQRASQGGTGNWISINAEMVRVRKVKLKTADVPPPENVSGSAAGRAGETNKPAGRSGSGGNAGGSRNQSPAAKPNQRDSILKMAVPERENNISGLIQRAISSGGV